jgi:ribosome-binding protein aMBF1 (putative translation factor)
MNDPDKIMFPCDICGQPFQFGRHIYNGKVIHTYELTVCRTCYDSNHDGWAPHYEQKILKHLKEKGIKVPERNESGWLPRE